MMFFPFQRTCREGGSTFFIMMSAGVFVFQTACTPKKSMCGASRMKEKKTLRNTPQILKLIALSAQLKVTQMEISTFLSTPLFAFLIWTVADGR